MQVIKGLMTSDPEQRLGVQGLSEAIEHPWFRRIEWDMMRVCDIPAPGWEDLQAMVRQPPLPLTIGHGPYC